jgi:WD40 repeat protein
MLTVTLSTSYAQAFVEYKDTTTLAWHPTGQYVAVLQDTRVDIVDADTREIVNVIDNLDTPNYEPVWSPDGAYLAFPNQNRVEVWEKPWSPEEARKIQELNLFDEGFAGHVSWSGPRIAMNSDTSILVFDAATFSPILQTPPTNPMLDLELRPDGERLAVSYNLDALVVLDPETGTVEWAFYLDSYLDSRQNYINPSPNGIAWSPSGEKLAFGATDGLRIIDFTILESDFPEVTVTGNPAITELERNYTNTDRVNVVDWHPTLNLVSSGDENGTVKVWDVETREVVAQFEIGDNVRVRSVAWSPDGTKLAYGLSPDAAEVPVMIVPAPTQ